MIIETISLREALKKIILERHEKPVIGLYEIHWYLYELYRDKSFLGVKIGKVTAAEPDYRVISDVLHYLVSGGVISKCIDGYVYAINGRGKPTAQQVVCCMNPCSYISYISAMEWHGITDRIPKILHVTHSSSAFLKKTILEKIKKEFPNIVSHQQLYPSNISGIDSFDGKKIDFHKKISFKMKAEQHGSGGVRVTSVGETFLDMLKEPDLCGGFDHVLHVFENNYEKYLPVIVKEITKNGNSMDKARAGYILEERLGVKNRNVDLWKNDVKRGGSRKLIPSKPYIHKWSETWCISIND